MPVLIEALSVVVRREAIARRYKGGWPGFVADALNKTLCADADIARLGFMHPDDVSAFVQRLERHRLVFLDAAGKSVDIVVVDQRNGPTTPCGWIEFYRQGVPGGTVSAARSADSREEELFCPNKWEFERSLSNNFEFHPSANVNEDLAFVRREHGTDVFRDRRTGKEVFIGRTSPLRGDEQPDAAGTGSEEYAALWTEAGKLLKPYLGTMRTPAMAEEIADVVRARNALERLTAFRNTGWRPWWLLGFVRRLLSNRDGAYTAFARAYGMAPDEIEVGRNLGAECIALGYGQEAISVTAAVSRLAPEDPGIAANHALALLIGSDVDGALREGQRAARLDPSDHVTQCILQLIQDVLARRVERPSRIET
jgi:Flp pilus assembly protein TadD